MTSDGEKAVAYKDNASEKDGHILKIGGQDETGMPHAVPQFLFNVTDNRRKVHSEAGVDDQNFRIKEVQDVIDSNSHIPYKCLHALYGIRVPVLIKYGKLIGRNSLFLLFSSKVF